jgi:hypothetical protein
MIARWTRSITALRANPRARVPLLTLYYLAIMAALFVLYSRKSFQAPSFIYQGF